LFSTNATDNFDSDFDAMKLFTPNLNVPQLYTLNTNVDELAINTLQSFNETTSIPLAFKTGVSGQYTISANELTFDKPQAIYLVDLKTNQIVNLQQQPTYSFTYNTADLPQRFVIRFSNSTTGISEVQNQVKVVAMQNTISVSTSCNEFINSSLCVYNSLGMLIAEQKILTNNTQITIEKPSGIYIVKVLVNNQIITKKVFLNN